MKKYIFYISIFFTFTVHAQDLRLYKGDMEVSGSGEFTQSQLGANIRFGSFIKDYMQIGVELSALDTEFIDRFALGLYIQYLFETQTYFLPYIGSGIAASTLDAELGDSESGAEFSLFTGLKYYMADNVSLNTEIFVAYSSGETFVDDYQAADSDYGVTIGLSFYW